jgi:flagellar biogenesis protein FliO
MLETIKAKLNKETVIVAVIFIIALIAMLAWAIHSVDIYNGTFP